MFSWLLVSMAYSMSLNFRQVQEQPLLVCYMVTYHGSSIKGCTLSWHGSSVRLCKLKTRQHLIPSSSTSHLACTAVKVTGLEFDADTPTE